MNLFSDLSNSEEYQSFRSSVPLKKISLDDDPTKVWKLYDAGPRSITLSPLICLPPASGTADVFYQQILYLTARGIRVISVQSPVYWSVADWCNGFKQLLDYFEFERVHLFGASLGKCQSYAVCDSTKAKSNDMEKIAEKIERGNVNSVQWQFKGKMSGEWYITLLHYRVVSIILCNSFHDTSIFNMNESAALYWILPGAVLKKQIVGNLQVEPLTDPRIAQAVEFMIEKLETLNQQEIASRLTLNCVKCQVDSYKLRSIKITIIDVFDNSALSSSTRSELKSLYTDAKFAQMKSGGNFPFLSRPEEVAMHIMIHLRQFSKSRYNAQLPTTEDLQRRESQDEMNADLDSTHLEKSNEVASEPEVAIEAK